MRHRSVHVMIGLFCLIAGSEKSSTCHCVFLLSRLADLLGLCIFISLVLTRSPPWEKQHGTRFLNHMGPACRIVSSFSHAVSYRRLSQASQPLGIRSDRITDQVHRQADPRQSRDRDQGGRNESMVYRFTSWTNAGGEFDAEIPSASGD